jgi:hypothetical protein
VGVQYGDGGVDVGEGGVRGAADERSGLRRWFWACEGARGGATAAGGPPGGVDNKNRRGIANVGIGYYLALLVDPPRSLFPLKYHNLIRCISSS